MAYTSKAKRKEQYARLYDDQGNLRRPLKQIVDEFNAKYGLPERTTADAV